MKFNSKTNTKQISKRKHKQRKSNGLK